MATQFLVPVYLVATITHNTALDADGDPQKFQFSMLNNSKATCGEQEIQDLVAVITANLQASIMDGVDGVLTMTPWFDVPNWQKIV